MWDSKKNGAEARLSKKVLRSTETAQCGTKAKAQGEIGAEGQKRA
jgi:hypothetical protein